ncbi:hypothetical protein C8F04DRAFT_1240654 [Mycena alexandri]|uniref:Uncharacterized protein n=1 Tax=Mycena alexandri TaxID=1745969 RepID=A0AAD6SC08_9AGAR|nr:hypothetical protein C8F04DRAFT_1240654 [Mycena alexandri]
MTMLSRVRKLSLIAETTSERRQPPLERVLTVSGGHLGKQENSSKWAKLAIEIGSMGKSTLRKLGGFLPYLDGVPSGIGFAIVKWLASVAYKTALVLSAGAVGILFCSIETLKKVVNWVTCNRLSSAVDCVFLQHNERLPALMGLEVFKVIVDKLGWFSDEVVQS